MYSNEHRKQFADYIYELLDEDLTVHIESMGDDETPGTYYVNPINYMHLQILRELKKYAKETKA